MMIASKGIAMHIVLEIGMQEIVGHGWQEERNAVKYWGDESEGGAKCASENARNHMRIREIDARWISSKRHINRGDESWECDLWMQEKNEWWA